MFLAGPTRRRPPPPPDATSRVRLLAAGAAPRRVHVWSRTPGERQPRLPEAIRDFRDLVTRTGARLLVLDPVLPFLDCSVNIGHDASIRAALEPLDERTAYRASPRRADVTA